MCFLRGKKDNSCKAPFDEDAEYLKYMDVVDQQDNQKSMQKSI